MAESGTFLSVDPVEGEPPYQYVRGNVVNGIDPSGYFPWIWEVGERQFYTCKCGWVDKSHAGPKTDFINDILGLRNETTSFGYLTQNRSTSPKGILIKNVDAEFVVYKEALAGKSAYEIALGIYIAYENFFETSQGLGAYSLTLSSYSEEDLVSDLIGFHRGIRETRGQDSSFEYFLELCGLVGFEYYDKNDISYNKAEFKRIQEQIYLEYFSSNPPFAKQYKWGKRPPGTWNGSVISRGNCKSLKCDDQSQLPAELLSITPKQPLDGWSWNSASLHTPLLANTGMNDFGNPILDPPPFNTRTTYYGDHLNSLPLNWYPE